MRLQRFVLELRPGVRRRVGDARLDDARAQPLEIGHPRLRCVAALGYASVADPGACRSSPTRARRARLGNRPLGSTDHMRATSSTLRAIGPTVSSIGTSGKTPSVGIRPHCDFSPTTSQAAEGRRIEQPVSVPSASSQSLAASAAAEPDDEPPVVRPGCAGLWHVRTTRLAEDAPGELGEMRLADEDGAASRSS